MLSHWHSHWQLEGPKTSLYNWINSIYNIPNWFPPNKKLVHLMTGHGHFQFYLKRFNITLSDRCSCGSLCVNELHYFNDCPHTSAIRQHFLTHTKTVITYKHFPQFLKHKQHCAHLLQLVTIMNSSTVISSPTRHIPDAD